MTDISDVEAAHGFTFGDDGSAPSAQAPAVATLVCVNPRCDAQGDHVEIHADTPLPVHCGSCFVELLAGADLDADRAAAAAELKASEAAAAEALAQRVAEIIRTTAP
jgi:hypothetical protein